jgi:hypothetical protein
MLILSGLIPSRDGSGVSFLEKKQKQFSASTKLKKLIILTQGFNEENNNKHIVPTSEQEPES